eukprot:344768-Amphidinium_carterae.1
MTSLHHRCKLLPRSGFDCDIIQVHTKLLHVKSRHAVQHFNKQWNQEHHTIQHGQRVTLGDTSLHAKTLAQEAQVVAGPDDHLGVMRAQEPSKLCRHSQPRPKGLHCTNINAIEVLAQMHPFALTGGQRWYEPVFWVDPHVGIQALRGESSP